MGIQLIDYRGRSRIFSREGANFQKKIKNFVDLFYRSTKLIFRAPPPPPALQRPCFGKHFCAAGKTLNKIRLKKAFLGSFGKLCPNNRVFSTRDPPSKLEYRIPEGREESPPKARPPKFAPDWLPNFWEQMLEIVCSPKNPRLYQVSNHRRRLLLRIWDAETDRADFFLG